MTRPHTCLTYVAGLKRRGIYLLLFANMINSLLGIVDDVCDRRTSGCFWGQLIMPTAWFGEATAWFGEAVTYMNLLSPSSD
jgi:hypothetical protein